MALEFEKFPALGEIPVRDFIGQKLPLVHGIFGCDLYDSVSFGTFERNLFPNPGWKALLLPTRIVEMNNDRFIDPSLWQGLCSDWYRSVNWLEVLMSVHWSRPCPTLFLALAGYFSDSFEELEIKYWDKDKECVVYETPAAAAVLDGLYPPAYGVFSTPMLIDPLGEWGMIDENEYSVSMLGAKGELFDRFVMALGGMEAIQKRFNYFLLLESRMDKREPLPADTYPDDIDEVRLGAFRPVYDRIGWPWPFPDHIGKEPFEG